MSPIALFLLVNLVYFFFAGPSDFATPFSWEVPGRIAVQAYDPGTLDKAGAARRRADRGPFHSRFTAPLVDRRVQARNAAARAASDGRRGHSYRDYRRAYDAKVPEISKTTLRGPSPLVFEDGPMQIYRVRRSRCPPSFGVVGGPVL